MFFTRHNFEMKMSFISISISSYLQLMFTRKTMIMPNLVNSEKKFRDSATVPSKITIFYCMPQTVGHVCLDTLE